MVIHNSIVYCNGKGGVLKSTGAAQHSGYAAASGWRVLNIDADAQANQSRDLGYVPDGGKMLAAALTGQKPLTPMPHPSRPSLHYVPGGPAVDKAMSELQLSLASGKRGALYAVERMLAPIADDFDVIIIDSPPRELLLRTMLFAGVRFIVVPCQVDSGSVDGIGGVLETVNEVRDEEPSLNPDLEVLGCFLGPIQQGATKTVRLARDRINGLVGDPDFVFEATVRAAIKIAAYCREHGILANEYEARAAEARRSSTRAHPDRHDFSQAASRLAEDWGNLIDEINHRYTERLTEDPAAEPEGVAS